MNRWISVKEGLPEDRGEPYQVIAAQKRFLEESILVHIDAYLLRTGMSECGLKIL